MLTKYKPPTALDFADNQQESVRMERAFLSRIDLHAIPTLRIL